jgi:signal peptidase II
MTMPEATPTSDQGPEQAPEVPADGAAGSGAAPDVDASPAPVGEPTGSAPAARPHWLLFIVLAATVIAIDQLAKAWVAASFQIGVPVPLIGDAVRITISHNQGALFGLFQGSAVVFGLVSLAVVGVIVWYESHAGQSLLVSIALGLLLGGATGNLVDRLRQGYVVDFVDAGLGAVRWFTFNLSDVSIDGAILLLILLTLMPVRGERPAPAERPA